MWFNYRIATLKGLQTIVRSFRSDYGAFYVFARNRVHTAWNTWTRELPTVRPYYAVKCNPDRTLLQTLSQLGAGFDCASGRELMEVADVGHGKECFHKRVVYANPCKPKRDLLKAKALGSPTTVIDSCEEVEKLVEVGWQGSALVRLLVEDTGSLMPFSRKFGLAQNSLTHLVDFAKQKGIRLSGVSFHVGSGCHTSEQYRNAILQSQKALGILNKAGNDAKLIDIGGGFLPTEDQFAHHARAIRKGIFGTLQEPYTYIAEPGRFFAEGSFDLFVQVIGKKPSLDGQGWRYTIDESLYGQFSCVPFDHKVPTWIRIPTSYEGKDFAPRKKVKGTLFGRTCDSLDLIAQSESMEDLEVGDWLWFPNMGAYTSVTASEFNGFPKPPLHGTDSMILLPSISSIQSEGFSERFPQTVQTVSPVRVAN